MEQNQFYRLERQVTSRALLGPTITHTLFSGFLGTVFSTVALVQASRRENVSGAAAINAISHWYHGDSSLHQQRVDVAHTGLGLLTHLGASVFWAGLFARVARNRPALRTTEGAVLGGVATSALACLVDYTITPSRFTPGYEHRLSKKALAGAYVALALGLAAGAIAAQEKARRDVGPDIGRTRRRR